VASRQTRDTGPVGAAREDEWRGTPRIGRVAWRRVPSANDNRPPLPIRLQRLLFLATAAASLGWLFWVGLLR
jgi:hypothetical protein